MATLHVSEADLVRDPAATLDRVRAGFEVVIEDEGSPIALLVPTEQGAEATTAEYDAWFVAQIEVAVADPRPSIDSEIVEAQFTERRRRSALRLVGMAE